MRTKEQSPLARPSFQRAVQSEAPANYAQIIRFSPGIIGQTQSNTSASGVCLAAVALEAKYSGVFRPECHIVFNDSSTGATIVEHSLVLVPFTNPATRFTGGGNSGLFFGNDVGQDLSDPNDWGQVASADTTGLAANGVLFDGIAPNSAAPGAVQLALRSMATDPDTPSGVVLGQMAFDWSGFAVQVGSLGKDKTRFARGTIVVCALLWNSLGSGDESDIVNYQSLALGMQESAYP